MHSVEKVNRLAVDRVLPAHHSLDIPVSLADEIAAAFRSLYNRNALVQGNGISISGRFRSISDALQTDAGSFKNEKSGFVR